MSFKIDTKANYTIITPTEAALDANLAEKLVGMVVKTGQSGSNNFIIDLNACREVGVGAIGVLLGLHEVCYEEGRSLVFTGADENIRKAIKASDEERILQVAPTLVEAIDIISMEILERDLMEEDQAGPEI